MSELTLQDTDRVGGGLSILTWIAQQMGTGGFGLVESVLAGRVDYAGIAESQGHYYNMTGA